MLKQTTSIIARQNELIKTGLCKKLDFNYQSKIKVEGFTFDFLMSREGQDLLKMAIRELDLTDNQLERLERIVKAMLLMENVKQAEACHIAEAVQYVTV